MTDMVEQLPKFINETHQINKHINKHITWDDGRTFAGSSYTTTAPSGEKMVIDGWFEPNDDRRSWAFFYLGDEVRGFGASGFVDMVMDWVGEDATARVVLDAEGDKDVAITSPRLARTIMFSDILVDVVEGIGRV